MPAPNVSGFAARSAVGETACTGLHGANRLASNSLVECMVFARSASRDILATRLEAPPAVPPWDDSRVTDADEAVVISHNWDELRRFMWDYVGIVRTNKRLERAAHRIRLLLPGHNAEGSAVLSALHNRIQQETLPIPAHPFP